MPVPSAALFEISGDRFVPSASTRGPWSPDAMHGGPPAALLARAVERTESDTEMIVTRITLELLRPVPLEPLTVRTRLLRPGRRVQLVEASLHSDAHEVARATALRIRMTELPIPETLPLDDASAPPPPDDGQAPGPSILLPGGFFENGVEHWIVRGAFEAPGPAMGWIRLRMPLVAGEETSPLCRACAAADFGNGLSGVLPSERFTYVGRGLRTEPVPRFPAWSLRDVAARREGVRVIFFDGIR